MKKQVEQAVILAGGMGTRLKPFTNNNPKPMYPINGVPFIEHLVLQVKKIGIKNIVILLGYLPQKVINYLGTGEKYGVKISYDITPESYDTLDRLIHAKEKLEESFLLMYCDNYCPIDFDSLVNNFYKHKASIELSVYDNIDLYTKNNVFVNSDGLVITYDKSREDKSLNGVEIGYAIVKKNVLDLEYGSNRNFSKAVFPKLVSNKGLFATVTSHRYYSIGSFERMSLTEEFFKPKKVVFLDRDGTINKRAPKACYIEKAKDFIWLSGAIEAIKMLNDNNIITILITNQPGIARGNLTIDDLNKIHDKMQSDLAKAGAKIDYIYYCPHNWDDGCLCRKPKPGLLYQAQKDLSLNLTECVFFGDDERDMEAAKAARVKGILVGEEYSLKDAVTDYLRGD